MSLTRSGIAVRGLEAAKYLQSLVTSDVLGLESVQATAFLTNKGRILADGLLWKHEDGILVDVASEQRDAVARHLKMYKLRSKVELKAIDVDIVAVDPRSPEIGERRCGDESHELKRRRFAAGIAQGSEIGGRVPLHCNLDLLGHVSFTKGCYLGQELTARAYHRGTVRKRILPIALVSPSSTLPAFPVPVTVDDTLDNLGDVTIPIDNDDKLSVNGVDVGTLIAHDGALGLAMLNLDFCYGDQLTDLPVVGDSSVLRILRPASWWPDALVH